MPVILGIETGTDVCSVALLRDGNVVAVREDGGGQDHARHLAVWIDEILHETGARVDAVAVGCGPGSYTGLRIGVSTAKGLCYGWEVPLVSVGSLEALACVAAAEGGFGEGSVLCPMIDARRMEVYAQLFDAEARPLGDVAAHVVDVDSFGQWRDRDFVIFGNGAQKCRELLPWARYVDVMPSARGLARGAFEAFAAGRFEDIAYFEPFYLKDFVVTTSKKPLF